MYAVFEDGSRQYRVSVGDLITIDYREAPVGARLELLRVLLLETNGTVSIGQPTVPGARVVAEIVSETKIKTMIQYFRRRKNYRRLKGHTQPYLQVRIKNILTAGEPTPSA